MGLATSLLAAMPLAECVAYVVFGRLLLRQGLLQIVDGESAVKIANLVTLPSLILQALSSASFTPQILLVLLVASVLHAAITTGSSWMLFSKRTARERGVLTGSSASLALGFVAYPLVSKVAGIHSLQLAVAFGALSLFMTHVASFLLVASGGAAFPDKYQHSDGGVYVGEWKGMRKEGLGTYTYKSGASYAGEWRDNRKEGYGVYTFKDGSAYEGEWSDGQRDGVGVRIFSSGNIKAGRWVAGDQVKLLELWQCSRAAEAAADAAEAAKKVKVGPGRLSEGLEALLGQPAFWASIAGLGLALSRAIALSSGQFLPESSLPASLQLITAPLAEAHVPLALMAFGLTLDLRRPNFRQMKDVTAVLAVRTCPAMVLCALASLAAPALGPVLAVISICCLASIPRQVEAYAHRFRSNEAFAVAASRFSELLSLVAIALFLVVAAGTWPDALCPWWVSVDTPGTVYASAQVSWWGHFSTLSVALSAGLVCLAVWLRHELDPANRQKLVYKAETVAPQAGAPTAAAAVATTAPTGPSSTAESQNSSARTSEAAREEGNYDSLRPAEEEGGPEVEPEGSKPEQPKGTTPFFTDVTDGPEKGPGDTGPKKASATLTTTAPARPHVRGPYQLRRLGFVRGVLRSQRVPPGAAAVCPLSLSRG